MQFYDARLHTGWLRNVLIRMAATGELMVNVVLGYEDEVVRKTLLDAVLQQFPEITTLLYTINTKWNDSIFDIEPQVYYGKGYILEKLEGFTFKISPKSFFQTNLCHFAGRIGFAVGVSLPLFCSIWQRNKIQLRQHSPWFRKNQLHHFQ